MPVYEYGCRVCGNEFEVEQSIKDDPWSECPKCRICCHNRLISGGSFVLKGSGWYRDGYSKNEAPKE